MDPHKAETATQLIRETLSNWGLGDLVHTALQLWHQGGGTDATALRLELENTKEWKQRFAGNELRIKEGLDPLSPAQYIAMEDGYRQVATQYGLSPSFYGHNYLAKLIGNNVSATEFQNRAQIALNTFTQAPDEYKAYWAKYGFTPGDAVSGIMDPNGESLADLQLKANAVQIGGTAAQNGVTVTGDRALALAKNGVTLAQARQAYSAIAQYGADIQQAAKRYGMAFGQTDMENAMLLDQADAVRKQNLIFGSEAANFSGHGGNSTASSSVGANY